MLQKRELAIIFVSMKQIYAIFLFAFIHFNSTLVMADALEHAIQRIESEWAYTHYNIAKEQRNIAFTQLLAELQVLNTQYPDQAELIIQQAIIVASNADNIDPLSALQAIHQARDLLLRAIALNPNASEGAAFVTLGSLYYRVPGWPIAYGDDDKAQAMLEKALLINPNTIDANYFYADFLSRQGQQQQAMKYFKRALAIPVRATQIFADTQLHNQVKLGIREISPAPDSHKQIFSIAYK